MDATRTHGSPSPTVAAGIVVGMLLMIVVPTAITLHSVHSSGRPAKHMLFGVPSTVKERDSLNS